jgi:hypothetical protein
MIRIPRRTVGAAAVTLLVAGGGLALSAQSAFAAPPPGGNDVPQCVNALIAAGNSNAVARSDDASADYTAAATQDATTGGYLFTAELNCYYTPSYSAYQDTIGATTDNTSAESANQAGSYTYAGLEEGSTATLITTALNIEIGYDNGP